MDEYYLYNVVVDSEIPEEYSDLDDIDVSLVGDAYKKEIVINANGSSTLNSENIRVFCAKCDSMTGIEWTPKATMPNRYSTGSYAKGITITGVPYGATYEMDKRIGLNISLETFMTAVNNPYSLLYTENVGPTSSSTSAWGISYNGVADYDGPYYANVCATFVDYALGLPCPYLSAGFPPLFESGQLISMTIPNCVGNLCIGDILNIDEHTRVVRDITYSSNGTIDKVIIAEQAGTRAHNTIYSLESLGTYCVNRNYRRYRPNVINEDLEMWEFDTNNYVYNNDICTFAGDKANFREGELIVLNYNLNNVENFSYTSIQLYKDNTLIKTYSLSNIDQTSLPEYEQNHAYMLVNPDDVTTYLSYGNYKARLAKGTTYSAFIEFKVVETNVTATMTNNGAAAIITFSSRNATPTTIALSTRHYSHAFYILSEDDKNAGSVTLYRNMFVHNKLYPANANTTYSVKVFFKTEYGTIRNDTTNTKIKFTY